MVVTAAAQCRDDPSINTQSKAGYTVYLFPYKGLNIIASSELRGASSYISKEYFLSHY